MKASILTALALVILSGSAQAQVSPAVTPEMRAREAKLLSHVGPETRAWIKQEAERQKTSSTFTGQLDSHALSSYPYASSLGSSDIDALMFLVMMEASKSANDDLKDAMTEVKTTNKEKSALRQASKQQMGDAASRRTQMMSDRKSKVMATLSNMMTKMSKTDSTIVLNLK